MKKQNNLSVAYIGSSQATVEKLNQLSGFQVSLTQFIDPIKAYSDLSKRNCVVQVVFCDIQQANLDAFYFLNKLKKVLNENVLVILLTGKRIPKNVLTKIRESNVNEVFQNQLKIEEMTERLLFLMKSTHAENLAHKEHQVKQFVPKMSFAKRAFDVVFASLALLMLSPLLLIVALAIKLDSKGPVFFISKRVGTGYKIFDFYKFRTMKTGADAMIDKMKGMNQYKKEETRSEVNGCKKCEELGRPCSPILYIDSMAICENQYQLNKLSGAASFMKFSNDPRVTKLGQYLRKSSIDELPQLFNILKGDMSFVGNRPLPLYEAEQLTSDQWSERFNAPAGLTGLWQVTKRGKSDMSEEERKQLDNEYAKRNSFWGDLLLILKTIPALTQKENV